MFDTLVGTKCYNGDNYGPNYSGLEPVCPFSCPYWVAGMRCILEQDEKMRLRGGPGNAPADLTAPHGKHLGIKALS